MSSITNDALLCYCMCSTWQQRANKMFFVHKNFEGSKLNHVTDIYNVKVMLYALITQVKQDCPESIQKSIVWKFPGLIILLFRRLFLCEWKWGQNRQCFILKGPKQARLGAADMRLCPVNRSRGVLILTIMVIVKNEIIISH